MHHPHKLTVCFFPAWLRVPEIFGAVYPSRVIPSWMEKLQFCLLLVDVDLNGKSPKMFRSDFRGD